MLGYLLEHDVMATLLLKNNNSLGIEIILYGNSFLVLTKSTVA